MFSAWDRAFRSALARCVECGDGGLPVGFKFGADALQGFERHFPRL